MTDGGAAPTAGNGTWRTAGDDTVRFPPSGAAHAAPDGAAPTDAGRAVRAAGGRAKGGGRPKGRWRAWRRSRPFWGGLLVTLGAIEMLVTLRAPLPVILKIGPQGLAGYLVPVILLLCGVLLLAHPPQRVFYALISMVLALVSWLTSNLGGFVIGMLLALVGACLAFAWTPVKAPRAAARPAEAAPDGPAGAAGEPAGDSEPFAGPPVPARPGSAPAQPAAPDAAADGRHRRPADWR